MDFLPVFIDSDAIGFPVLDNIQRICFMRSMLIFLAVLFGYKGRTFDLVDRNWGEKRIQLLRSFKCNNKSNKILGLCDISPLWVFLWNWFANGLLFCHIFKVSTKVCIILQYNEICELPYKEIFLLHIRYFRLCYIISL